MLLSLLPNGVMEDFCCITDTVDRCTFLYRSFSTAQAAQLSNLEWRGSCR